MYIAVYFLADGIFWRLSPADPLSLPVTFSPGWSLINPILYWGLPSNVVVPFGTQEPLPLGDGSCLLHSRQLAFTCDSRLSAEAEFAALRETLVRMRHISGQATISRNDPMLSTTTSLDQLPGAQFPAGFKGTMNVAAYPLETAIMMAQVAVAFSEAQQFVPPSYENILLDAIAAHRTDDFRKAILYAAIACESAVGTTVDEAYEKSILTGTDRRWRVVSTRYGSQVVAKDPVYEKLRNNRSDFRGLLHELSLYVLGRSLLIENENLYQDAMKLHATRNKLAHIGDLPSSPGDQYIQLDSLGSLKSIKTAVELFGWLGLRHDYVLPDFRFTRIECKAPQE
jgi:hypothetical protein